MFMHYFFMLHNFPENSSAKVIFSVWPMHDKNPFASGFDLHFFNRIGKTVRTPPMFDVFGVCPYFPNQFYWAFSKRDVLCSLRDGSLFSFCMMCCLVCQCLDWDAKLNFRSLALLLTNRYLRWQDISLFRQACTEVGFLFYC